MPKTKSKDAKIDFRGNPLFRGQFPSLANTAVTSTVYYNLSIISAAVSAITAVTSVTSFISMLLFF